MKRYSYGERDYTFGQMMLTLRTNIGLTQAGLAERIGVSRRAVAEWEAGSAYPKAERLKLLIALGVQQQAFSAGSEEEEIRVLWKAAHQKVLLDEPLLQELLGTLRSRLAPVEPQPGEQTRSADQALARPALRSRADWGEALAASSFYDREEEVATLTGWVVEDRCRVVSVLGLGGIGKSALAVTVMHQVAKHFAVVLWRSLSDAPSCEALIEDCLRVLSSQPQREVPTNLEGRLGLLLEHLREERALLVLDNLDVLLEEGAGTGRMRAGYEDYAHLLRRVAETAHQSCLLLTSREKPAELAPLEGSRSPVRSVRLAGLDGQAGARLLAEKEVVGAPNDQVRLVEMYRGNPLALKIVAHTIMEIFEGEIVPFLEQGEVVFGGVRELLDEQFTRLSALEQSVLLWLAILREPVSLEELLAVFSTPRTPMQVLEALDRLSRRSLIERGQRPGSFTLQSVVLEYTTARLVEELSSEIEQGHLDCLIAYGLCQAQAKEYVRQTQERLLVVPLLTRLQSTLQGHADLETRLLWLLDGLRGRDQTAQGYGPANLAALLRVLRGDLRGLDLSRLALRGVFLQGVEMQDANLRGAVLRDSVFTEPLDAIWAVAISPTGEYWAAASRGGKVWVWKEAGQTLHRVWQAHTASVTALAFGPDGHTLVSGGWDNTLKLWDVEPGTLLWEHWQTGGINSVAFAPDGRLLASGGSDTFVQVWNPQSGTNVQTLAGEGGAVYSLTWSPDGRWLASGCSDGSIWLWEPDAPEPGTRVQVRKEHAIWVTGLAFSPDGLQLASASLDSTIKLWDMEHFDCLHTFSDQLDRVLRLAWSPDGRTLASGSFDHTIRLWEIKERRSRAVLRGHTSLIYALAFTPESRTLLSGSDDGTLRLWDVDSGQGLRFIGGYSNSLFCINWSPDGTQLVSGGTDTLVTLWDAASGTPTRVLRGHRWMVQGVAWSPDGRLLASGGYDNSIRLWDPATGECLEVLQDPDAPDTLFQDVVWSPDGSLLACGSYPRGGQVWDMTTLARRWVGQTQPTLIRRVAWNPDGTRVVGGADDGSVYVWDGRDGTQQQKLAGHQGVVMSVAWSSDGNWLASGGGGRGDGELFVWDVQSGERRRAFAGHHGLVSEVAWSPRGELLVSAGSDGELRWWEVESGECLWVHEGHQGTVHALNVSFDGSRLASCGDDGAILLWDLHNGELLQTLRRDRPYERLNISEVRGLTEAQKAMLHALGAIEDDI